MTKGKKAPERSVFPVVYMSEFDNPPQAAKYLAFLARNFDHKGVRHFDVLPMVFKGSSRSEVELMAVTWWDDERAKEAAKKKATIKATEARRRKVAA